MDAAAVGRLGSVAGGQCDDCSYFGGFRSKGYPGIQAASVGSVGVDAESAGQYVGCVSGTVEILVQLSPCIESIVDLSYCERTRG